MGLEFAEKTSTKAEVTLGCYQEEGGGERERERERENENR